MGVDGQSSSCRPPSLSLAPLTLTRENSEKNVQDNTDRVEQHHTEESEECEEQANCGVRHRRRTSLPSAFTFGTQSLTQEPTDGKDEVHTNSIKSDQRRPRSFDCLVSSNSYAEASQRVSWKRYLRSRRSRLHTEEESDLMRHPLSTTLTPTSMKNLTLLETRIQYEQNQVLQCANKIWKVSFSGQWFNSMRCVLSSRRKELNRVKNLRLVIETAQKKRSLDLLNDLRLCVLSLEDEDEFGVEDNEEDLERDSETEPRKRLESDPGDNCTLESDKSRISNRYSTTSISSTSSSSSQQIFEVEDTETMLAYDTLNHVLRSQSQWLRQLIELRKKRKSSISKFGLNKKDRIINGANTLSHRESSADIRLKARKTIVQNFLASFRDANGSISVPYACDIPTIALVQFEKIVVKYQLIKPAMKEALDALYDDTLKSFIGTDETLHCPSKSTKNMEQRNRAQLFDERDSRDVMASITREIVDSILELAQVSPSGYRYTLYLFVEQMIFSRLVCACYRPIAMELDDLNTIWRMQLNKVRTLSLQEAGLPNRYLSVSTLYFCESLHAVNQMPYLVPSAILSAYMKAIRLVHEEAATMLNVSRCCISADVLLPALVYILSRSDLPHIHSQVYLMEHFSVETLESWQMEDCQDAGSETAYYVACLQAAIGYIMSYDPAKSDANCMNAQV
uniref:Uncharacterized protein AlNc14C41G3525 n=1 Tax=Albugo laibachii Nc14 TaxID=890382 RepID=F0W9S1_9STRA|nr:conserved hypothetical protein [Albugo laibachii Nc14]|eukprot:CCA17889.1 conserved hypothetical protein [Albugo laibachii Nc14]